MLKLSIKKSQIKQSFKWKKQTHPWDMISETAKTKQHDQPARTHEVAKHFRRNLFNFHEGPTSQLDEIFVNPQEPNLKQNMPDNLQLFEESQNSEEGFFPCPTCTCWFTNQKDLDFHVKRWCDR